MTTLNDLISRVAVAMLTTVDSEGTLSSRPMLALETDGHHVWFLTRHESEKMGQIANDARVNLALLGTDGDYTSISGQASQDNDRKRLERLWNVTYRAWFPGGLDDADIVLLCVTVDKVDYWKTPSSRVERLVGLVKAVVTGKPQETMRQSIPLETPKPTADDNQSGS